MPGESRAPWWLLGFSVLLAALGLAELLFGGPGITFPLAQLAGAALGLFAHRKGAPRPLAFAAIGVNVAILVGLLVGSYLFGGT
jgi:uncharacterized membrane protein YjjP (DUF1212 family)